MFIRQLLNPIRNVRRMPVPLRINPVYRFCTTPNNAQELQQLLNQIKIQKGQNTQEYATKLLQIANVYVGMGQVSKAVDNFQKCSQVVSNIYGKDHIMYLNSLRKTCECCMRFQQFGKALQITFAIKQIQQKLYEQKSKQHIATNHQIGTLFKLMKNNEDAKKWLGKALEMQGQNFGKNTKDYTTVKLQIARIDAEENKIDSAIEHYRQGIEIFQKYSDQTWMNAAILNGYFDMVSLHVFKGDKEKAAFYIQKVQKHIDPSHNDYMGNINKLVQHYALLGQSKKAIEALKDSLGHIQKKQGKNLTYATILTTIATTLHGSGQNKEALDFVVEAKEIYERLGKTQQIDWALVLSLIGTIKSALNNNAQAAEEFKKALQVWKYLGSAHLARRATIKTLLGKVYIYLNELENAEHYLKDALKEERQLGNVQNIFHINSFLTVIAYNNKNYQVALEYSLTNDELVKKHSNPQMTLKMERENVPLIMDIYTKLNQFQNGAPFVQRSKKYIQNLGKDALKIYHLQKIAAFYEAQQKYQQSAKYYEQVISDLSQFPTNPQIEERKKIIEEKIKKFKKSD